MSTITLSTQTVVSLAAGDILELPISAGQARIIGLNVGGDATLSPLSGGTIDGTAGDYSIGTGNYVLFTSGSQGSTWCLLSEGSGGGGGSGNWLSGANTQSKRSDYTILTADRFIRYTGSGGHTFLLPASPTLGEVHTVWNSAGQGSVIVDGNGREVSGGAGGYTIGPLETHYVTFTYVQGPSNNSWITSVSDGNDRTLIPGDLLFSYDDSALNAFSIQSDEDIPDNRNIRITDPGTPNVSLGMVDHNNGIVDGNVPVWTAGPGIGGYFADSGVAASSLGGGGSGFTYATTSGDYSVPQTGNYVINYTGSGGHTITLHATPGTGQQLMIVNSGTGNVTIDAGLNFIDWYRTTIVLSDGSGSTPPIVSLQFSNSTIGNSENMWLTTGGFRLLDARMNGGGILFSTGADSVKAFNLTAFEEPFNFRTIRMYDPGNDVQLGMVFVGGLSESTIPKWVAGPTSGGYFIDSEVGIPVAGRATLVGGTVTVSTTAANAGSRFSLTVHTPGGTQGFLSVGTITNGTSFVINSTSVLETSEVDWIIIN